MGRGLRIMKRFRVVLEVEDPHNRYDALSLRREIAGWVDDYVAVVNDSSAELIESDEDAPRSRSKFV